MPYKEKLSSAVVDRVSARAREAFQLKEFRPVVVAAIRKHDEDGKVLLVQSAHNPNDWSCPQGGVEAGEWVHVTLCRELREELSLGPEDFSIDYFLGEQDLRFEADRLRKQGFSLGKRYFFFELTCNRPDAVVINPAELGAARWVHRDDLSRVMARTRAERRDMVLAHLALLS